MGVTIEQVCYLLRRLAFLSFILFPEALKAQGTIYFPPTNTALPWDTISPNRLGYCQNKIDSLYTFLRNNNTKAFILMKDGKIVLEQYFNGHSANANWYWASAGKTLTAFLVGVAQQEGLLSINDSTSRFLGRGWSSLSAQQEGRITIRNQLTMTSGLNDAVADPYCTSPSCLTYLAAPGTRWAYHNGPYTLLDTVLRVATGRSLNVYINQKLKNPTGMDGLFLPQGFNTVYYSTARSMARFGSLILNRGNWNGSPILSDSNYFNAMVNSSQSLNESYGFLWWLNGKNSFMIPQSRITFPGSFIPNAPADMFSAMGRDGQFLNIIPSQNIVWLRMGENPDNSLVPFTLNNEIAAYINALICRPVSAANVLSQHPLKVYPNPVQGKLFYSLPSVIASGGSHTAYVKDMNGRTLVNSHSPKNDGSFEIDVEGLAAGLYLLEVSGSSGIFIERFVKE